MSNQFGIGVSNVSKIIHDVTSAILSHMWNVYIRLSEPAEAVESMREWKQQTGVPGIMGALDGTHIHIRKPLDLGLAGDCVIENRSGERFDMLVLRIGGLKFVLYAV